MEMDWKDEILYKDIVKWEKRLKNETPFFKELLKDTNCMESKILDVSCGTGIHLAMLAQIGYRGVGIDISNQNIYEANKIAKERKLDDKLSFILGDMLEIETIFQEEEFDFIYCIGNTLAIFNNQERKKIIDQLIKILRPGGKLLLQVVNYLSHETDEEWFYNPNSQRSTNGEINFHVRIMEWKDKFEKINMYVLRLKQKSDNSNDFELIQKKTEFYVLKKEDFDYLSNNKVLKLKFLGNYQFAKFDKKESNDLILIIEKEPYKSS